MSANNDLKAVTSALEQAGAAAVPYRTAQLGFAEMDPPALVRLRGLHRKSERGPQTEALPALTGHSQGVDPCIICLRPGDWLVVSQSLSPAELLRQYRSDDGDRGPFAFDQSDAFAVFRVKGPAAPWLLGKFTGLDVSALGAGNACCAQTKFAHISVLIHQHVNATGSEYFDLFVDRSLASYLWNLLAAGAPHAQELYDRWVAKGPGRS